METSYIYHTYGIKDFECMGHRTKRINVGEMKSG